ncbi:type VII secretion protein EccB [Catenuloplanes atrovinosus]|uniref:Type VII secretion protein EccB n=1 Tax=Catenuloplanes atrovinosus TaxID=137266 RepID=A0AAE3YTL2_9ACTN|nr:type VII secretion protein EccB [Catenuloplanes atrovinosus]MDR7279683.1 type VII secretion protein EccB [Catenuloplanes atrovinosus]
MPSRQDQLHAYRFAVRRVVAALVTREIDPARAPFARSGGAVLAGLLVAVLAAGAVLIYDLFTGGGATRWRDERVVVVERETGARYVYRDARLHPVVNYASALLIVGAAGPETVLVSRRSIEGVPRGVPLGIVDAPDSLPPPDRLAGPPWALCSEAGAPVLLAGPAADGGTRLDESGALVAVAGETFLLWRDRRHPVASEAVLSALGWGAVRPADVGAALLNAVPLGSALTAPPVPGLGGPSSAVAGAIAGRVYVVATQGGSREYAVALAGGLAAITQVQADILLGDPRTGQSGPVELSQAAYASAPRAGDLRPADGPAATPALMPVEGALCGVAESDAGLSGLRVGVRLPPADGYASTAVRMEPGRGALVEAAAAPGASGGTISLVTAAGRRHALASPDVLPMLGYPDATPLRLPAVLVELIPEGAALDPAAAVRPARP